MIPRAHITAWRSRAPWSSDAQVEQDLVLSRAIVEIFSDPFLSAELAARGGTILHKLFLDPPARYSEDIDLVQVNAGSIKPILTALRARLDPWLGESSVERRRNAVRLQYRFNTEIEPVTRMRVKIEINTREHFTILGHDRRPFEVENPWFSGAAAVITFRAEELLATKLRALYQRKKGRDLYDLATFLDRQPELDVAKIVSTFEAYLDRASTPISRADYDANLTAKLLDPVFGRDVAPLLAPARGAFLDDAFFDARSYLDSSESGAFDIAKAAV
ncbi:MAG: nucleotidyl transferase AbiEii/AbiGii toxin family protein [Deltaproteobacteria bacterium]|nr:nucleotidyl transferase AbiEii/AbiGii toxin family protein [Deltaproteobacteria bacterium]